MSEFATRLLAELPTSEIAVVESELLLAEMPGRFPCPFCNSSYDEALVVSDEWRFYCFECGAHGVVDAGQAS